jgi:hypothetical protein
MLGMLLRGFTFANVCSFLALTIALGTGTAYAANTVFSTDIVDGEVKNVDLADNSVTTGKITPNHVYSVDVRDDTLANGGLTAVDLAPDSVTTSELLDGTVAGLDVLDGSLTGDDIASSSLTGSDVSNGSLTGSDILDESLGTTDLADGGINTSDLALSSITGSRIAPSAVTGSDIANRTVNMDDIDGADRSGAIGVGSLSNGRCTTITGNVSGTRPGDAVVLTTNGTIPNGMVIYAQRALENAVHIKVCNLSGATSAAITDLPVRVITFH